MYVSGTTEPVPDGRVHIVDDATGSCLRLSQSPTPGLVTFPSGITCDSVPWNTSIVLGACTGEESPFYVTPWAPEDTSPGLTEPEVYGRWRIRPHLRCRASSGLEVMKYGDACLDANSLGDHVLRVFWCHDGPRQQLRAPDWY